MGKTIVVIPGSQWQVPLVKKIKKMGHRALVVNPYKDSPAFMYADGFLQRDIFDEEAVVAYCRENSVNAIMSDECDIAMNAVAQYGERLNCSTLSVDVAKLFTDKYVMREFCKTNDFSTPCFKKCISLGEAVDFFESKKMKMILKPLDSNSSRGVFTIDTKDDLSSHFEESYFFSRNQKAVLLEEYIDGVEFTVDGIKTPDRHYSLVISKKKHFDYNTNIASELYFSHFDKEFDYDLLRETNDRFIDASGLLFGLTHAEYKFANGRYYLIEVAARGGGNLISSDIVPFMSGIDNYKYLIDCSLGSITSPVFDISCCHKNKASVLKFFDTPKQMGTVKKIEGLNFLRQCKDIISYKFNFKVGDTISFAKDDAARVGYYIACCENGCILGDLMDSIRRLVRITLADE